MALGEYIGAGSGVTKLLLHLNGNSNDSSGNGNNGTDTNISYSNDYGKFGQGARFSNSIIKVPNLGVSGTSARTYSVWSKINDITAQNDLIYNGSWTIDGRGIDLLIWSTNPGALVLFMLSTRFYTANSLISQGIWYNFIFTFDGGATSTTSNVSLYINGEKQAISKSGKGNINTDNSGYYIGNNTSRADIDEVIIENRAWTAVEVRKYYTMAKGRFGI